MTVCVCAVVVAVCVFHALEHFGVFVDSLLESHAVFQLHRIAAFACSMCGVFGCIRGRSVLLKIWINYAVLEAVLHAVDRSMLRLCVCVHACIVRVCACVVRVCMHSVCVSACIVRVCMHYCTQ